MTPFWGPKSDRLTAPNKRSGFPKLEVAAQECNPLHSLDRSPRPPHIITLGELAFRKMAPKC